MEIIHFFKPSPIPIALAICAELIDRQAQGRKRAFFFPADRQTDRSWLDRQTERQTMETDGRTDH